jgi:hypothetical protein
MRERYIALHTLLNGSETFCKDSRVLQRAPPHLAAALDDLAGSFNVPRYSPRARGKLCEESLSDMGARSGALCAKRAAHAPGTLTSCAACTCTCRHSFVVRSEGA